MSGDFWRLIESPQNANAKRWSDLHDGRGIRKHGEFLLAGRKAVPEALRLYPDRFKAMLACDPADAADLDLLSGIDRFRLSRALFDSLDISGTNFPLLVGKAPPLPSADLAAAPRGLELVCALGDPSNLGALFRSAAAFGVSRVILLEEAAHPFHPRTLRAAANAQFELELLRGPSWKEIGDVAGPLVALDGRGEDMASFAWPRDIRLVLGEEGLGIPSDFKARRLAIPTTGAVESLNATVAASLALYAYYLSAR
ncbi:MAG: RNA methyltransferase [Parvibaculum sp.]|uniref:TrmH family RNA methyltransferase n=1 Tax=Parvibaculum sp. TaxID=2024848 RepID=UPI0025D3D8FC|nr:RNA methyltransferase [Parvibaculum sp.]MCE9649779.1 RNA methyltransferase [Parvibaculum sp.]